MVFVFLIGTNACKESSTASDKSVAIVQNGEAASVLFGLKKSGPVSGSNHSQDYDCTYQARGKVAKFRLELSYGPMSGTLPIARGEGKFLAVQGSEGSALLEDLLKTLDAKHYPIHSRRVAELAFDAVVLGEHQDRSSSGGFADGQAGDWIVIKLFLPKGGDDGEVFLNLNPTLGKGEFSIKDSDYGDFLLEQLAKVL
jgi:hypothetical protein